MSEILGPEIQAFMIHLIHIVLLYWYCQSNIINVFMSDRQSDPIALVGRAHLLASMYNLQTHNRWPGGPITENLINMVIWSTCLIIGSFQFLFINPTATQITIELYS